MLIENPTDMPVLLFEGEEVLGAQQNRTFDVTILVAAGTKLQIPVSCVEAGRWDGGRSSEHFSPAPQAAHPELRRDKASPGRAEPGGRRARARAARARSGTEVAAKAERMDVTSATGALHDVYEGHRDRLAEFNEAIRLRDGQSGALVAIGDSFVVLDWVSRPEVFASLHGALLQGYALDALEGEAGTAPSRAEAEGFVSLATSARSSERDGIGLGREVRFAEVGADRHRPRGRRRAGPVDGAQQPIGSAQWVQEIAPSPGYSRCSKRSSIATRRVAIGSAKASSSCAQSQWKSCPRTFWRIRASSTRTCSSGGRSASGSYGVASSTTRSLPQIFSGGSSN